MLEAAAARTPLRRCRPYQFLLRSPEFVQILLLQHLLLRVSKIHSCQQCDNADQNRLLPLQPLLYVLFHQCSQAISDALESESVLSAQHLRCRVIKPLQMHPNYPALPALDRLCRSKPQRPPAIHLHLRIPATRLYTSPANMDSAEMPPKEQLVLHPDQRFG